MNSFRKVWFLMTAVFALILAGTARAAGGSIPVDAAHFPDDVFRSDVADQFDTDKDGSLSAEEISEIVDVGVRSGIKSVKGIEYFPNLISIGITDMETTLESIDATKNPNLESLFIAYTNTLREVKVSGLKKLRSVEVQKNDLLERIDITGCTELLAFVDEDHRRIDEDYNRIEYKSDTGDAEFYISGWTDIVYDGKSHLYGGLPISPSRFPDRTFREKLRLHYNEYNPNSSMIRYDINRDGCLSEEEISQIVRYEFTGEKNAGGVEYLTSLKEVYISSDSLSELDLSSNSDITHIDCAQKTLLKKLNIRGCRKLETLSAYGTKNLKIDMTGNKPLLEDLYNSDVQYEEWNGTDAVFYAYRKIVADKTAKLIFKKNRRNTISADPVEWEFSLKKQKHKLNVSARDNPRLTFKSSDRKHFAVSSKGVVTVSKAYVGRATITVTAAETFRFIKTSKKFTVTVNPGEVSFWPPSCGNTGKGKVKLVWNKTASTKATGYQIQYTAKSEFKSPKKTAVKGIRNVTKTIKNLKKGKTYHFRIRTYLKKGKSVFYSNWNYIDIAVEQ